MRKNSPNLLIMIKLNHSEISEVYVMKKITSLLIPAVNDWAEKNQ